MSFPNRISGTPSPSKSAISASPAPVGAVISRGTFIGVGAAAIHRFHWVLYLLGAFLVLTSIKILVQDDKQMDPSRNLILQLFRRLVPVTPE